MALLAIVDDARPPPTRGAPEPVPRLEPPAFAELYESHADGVFALVTRLLGPSPDREDVLQQAFLQVYLALGLAASPRSRRSSVASRSTSPSITCAGAGGGWWCPIPPRWTM